MNNTLRKISGLFGLLLLVSACSSKTTLEPVTLTAQQQKLFQQSCQSCHLNSASPAPQMGDIKAWQKRLEKGLPVLVQNAMQGINAMPAGGLCTVCTPDDMDAMIRYMATAPSTTPQ